MRVLAYVVSVYYLSPPKLDHPKFLRHTLNCLRIVDSQKNWENKISRKIFRIVFLKLFFEIIF
jgi:hypothetical protein